MVFPFISAIYKHIFAQNRKRTLIFFVFILYGHSQLWYTFYITKTYYVCGGAAMEKDKHSIQHDLESIDELYNKLNSRAEKLYDLVYYYSKYMKEPRDYGTGSCVSMPMVHILTTIEQEPGLTISHLAKERNRTVSAISQTVKALELEGYIRKEKRTGNDKELLLYPTEKGKKLARAHKIYDINDMSNMTDKLLQYCSIEDLDTFYRIIALYLDILPKK